MKSLKSPLLSLFTLILLSLILNYTTNAYIQLMFLFIFMNVIVSLSLNLINGVTGQFSLGHAGFMAIGAYTSTMASQKLILFPDSLSILNFIIWGFLAGVFSALAGFLVGLPSLRLKGDYLAIVTLGFSEIIRVILLNIPQVGGARGIAGIQALPQNLFNLPLDSFIVKSFYASLTTLFTFFILWRIYKSKLGRAFLSVREDEIAATAMGINTTKTKIIAFMISSFFAGVAGHLFAHITQFIYPSSFGFLMSVNAVIMVVLGGLGSFTGAILSAVFITLLPELLRPLQDLTGFDFRMILYSLILILIMILRPKGIMGANEFQFSQIKFLSKKSKESSL